MDAAVVVFEALTTNTLVRFWPIESVPLPLLLITVNEYAPLRLVC
jgi:Na+/serine symporter